MESNFSEFKTNVTIDQVIEFFNLSDIVIDKLNITNDSEVSKIHLFDLYEAYKTKEREQLNTYKLVAYVLGALIVLSNLVVVVSSGLILKKGQQPKSTYLLLGNVSLADTIIGISLIFGATVDNSMSSNPLCIFQIGMLVCPAMVSIFSVGLIAVDRYIYILHGLYYQRWFNTTRVRIGIACIWMVGVTLGFMPITGWVNKELITTRCVYVAVFPGALILFNSLLSVIPIIAVAILYVIILKRALKNFTQMKASGTATSTKSETNEKPKLRMYRGGNKIDNSNSVKYQQPSPLKRSASFNTNYGIFTSFLPAMGWTGKTFRDYRCWYIAVFPPSLLIILSIVVLLVIILVCVLYVCILHSAVKTVDKIREFKESNIAYVNRAFEDECNKMSKTTVTITVSTETVTQANSMEMHELSKTNIQERRCHNRLKQNFSNFSRYYCRTKAVNSSPSKLKAVKTVLLVTFCFVGTWAPYYVAIILYVKCDILVHGYDCVPLEILTLGPLYLLGASNSLFDPLIYAWRHSGFKRSLKRMYWKYISKMKL